MDRKVPKLLVKPQLTNIRMKPARRAPLVFHDRGQWGVRRGSVNVEPEEVVPRRGISGMLLWSLLVRAGVTGSEGR